MQLCYEHGVYYAVSAYEEVLGDTPTRTVLKDAGFRWNPDVRRWETTDSYRARQFRTYADVPCALHLETLIAEQERTKALSKATTVDVDLPCPDGLAYRPFQKAAILFAAERSSVLIGDAMGTGKSIEALGVLNYRHDIHTVLVVCPATLKINWRNEAQKWLLPALAYDIAVVDTTWKPAALLAFFRGATHGQRKLAIINYDIMHRFGEKIAFTTAGKRKAETFTILGGMAIDLLVADECHLLKTAASRRSKAVRGVTAKRKLLLSGTPIVNRPKELFPLLNYLDPFTWNNFFQYGLDYCNAHQNSYGWDFSGASRLPELHDKLRGSILIRRLRSDVLPELPAKVRQVIELPLDGAAGVVAAEQHAYAQRQATLRELQVAVELAKAADSDELYTMAVHNLRRGMTAALTDMTQLRHDTAMAKLPQVLAHIIACLEEEEKVVVFFHHHDVAYALEAGLQAFHPAIITGETPLPHRQAAVERFQQETDCRVFLGSITAAGVGITLTAAAHVVFGELSWVPGEVSQCEDRTCRIGQKESVLVQHLVLEGSLDATMARTIIAKQQVIDAALDSTEAFTVEEIDAPVVPVADPAPDSAHAATAGLSRNQVAVESIQFAPAEVLRVHRALQYLAGVCDFAHARDGQGFNLVDARIGHQLAMAKTLSPRQAVLGHKILTKYHAQLAGDLAQGTGGTA